MPFSFYYTCILLVIMTVVLIREWLEVELTLFSALLLLLGIALVYMVMAGQFESWRDPFVVLFSIPMAIIATPMPTMMRNAKKTGQTGDEGIGVDIVRRALEEPMRQLARNAGREGGWREQPRLSGEQGREILKFALAALRSSRLRREVYLDEMDAPVPWLVYRKKRAREMKAKRRGRSIMQALGLGRGTARYAGRASARGCAP